MSDNSGVAVIIETIRVIRWFVNAVLIIGIMVLAASVVLNLLLIQPHMAVKISLFFLSLAINVGWYLQNDQCSVSTPWMMSSMLLVLIGILLP